MSKIFVCVGSRPYQFNRLFKELDRLIEQNIISSDIFAQIGSSSYQPLHYSYKSYLSSKEFISAIKAADIVISHGASGSIMSALNLGKPVIAVTRLAKYGEHINDHQIGINTALGEENLVVPVLELDQLGHSIRSLELGETILEPWNNPNREAIVDAIDLFIQQQLID